MITQVASLFSCLFQSTLTRKRSIMLFLQTRMLMAFMEECGCGWKVKNVGMPIAQLLHTDGACEGPGGNATVTVSHPNPPKEQPRKHTVLADILVGDVDFEGVRKKASDITPVPGVLVP
ncbi:hypothetical protein GH733_006424 [Mirounga leonina]|nr:hypothetical protein GH733_006424 [Mirounga leonina]